MCLHTAVVEQQPYSVRKDELIIGTPELHFSVSPFSRQLSTASKNSLPVMISQPESFILRMLLYINVHEKSEFKWDVTIHHMPMVSSLQRMTFDVLRVGNGFMFYCFYWTMVIHFPHYFSCPFKIFVLVQSPDTLSMMSNMRVCMGYRHSGMHARFASVRQHEPYA